MNKYLIMDWNNLLTSKRLGKELEKKGGTGHEVRSQFQRDYDRIIFSSAFRRLQNKTQVFPLPGRVFVHNRLTHTLEVASVGRSLGNYLAEMLFRNQFISEPVLLSNIGAAVSAACLAHDMGNPPYGHSGESAISSFFLTGAGNSFKSELSEPEWNDFVHFDGNANAFRLLTHPFKGKREGGFALTYTTLASIVKYPFESSAATAQKFGFFQSEKETWKKMAYEMQIPVTSENPLSGNRHPLVYLVEAADDICYQIMDVEDAFKLGILSYDDTRQLLMAFHLNSSKGKLKEIEKTLHEVSDPNEQISYLRAGVIGKLTRECFSVFEKNHEGILEGNFHSSLLKNIDTGLLEAMKKIQEISWSDIYNHRSVVEIEIAGYKILGTLLEEFIGALMSPNNPLSQKILKLIPVQYDALTDTHYHKIQTAVDFISGMTDVYALDLYRKIKGISLPEVGN
jgi:dGTPase